MGKKTDLKYSCAYCSYTSCINLFRHTKDEDKLVGGELYVYKLLSHSEVLDEELSKHICANGKLLQCACFLVGPAYVALPEEEYLTSVCNEVVRDMKASFYLAMSGHYRQAILIQRCVFENFLYGLYFTAEHYKFSRSEEDRKIVKQKFMSWVGGGFRKSEDYLLDIIEKGGLITKVEKKDWGTLFNELSKFIHTLLHTPTGKRIKYGNVEIPGCYAVVEFNKENLIEWSSYFQRLLFLILNKLLIIYPFTKDEDAGRLALKLIRGNFKDIREELNNPYLDALLKMRGGKSIVKPKLK